MGFVLKEDIIKVQHNCSATERRRPKAKKGKFYIIMHKYLSQDTERDKFVFRKPKDGENLGRVMYSLFK